MNNISKLPVIFFFPKKPEKQGEIICLTVCDRHWLKWDSQELILKDRFLNTQRNNHSGLAKKKANVLN